MLTIDAYQLLRTARRSLLGFEDDNFQVWSGEPTEGQVARVTACPSHSEVLRALGPISRRDVCRGGTVQVMSDVWEDCRGCCGCAGVHTAGFRAACGSLRDACSDRGYDRARDQFEACRAVGIFVWRVTQLNAHAELYRAVTGFEALAQIGRMITAVGSIGNAIGAFARDAVAVGRTPAKGY